MNIIRTFLRDCTVDLSVGIYPEEQTRPQPVVINVEVEANLAHRYDDAAEKDTARVIDYAALYHFVQNDVPALGHIGLLEAVAERILDFCWRDERVTVARVRVEKTSVFPHARGAGVDLRRTRV